MTTTAIRRRLDRLENKGRNGFDLSNLAEMLKAARLRARDAILRDRAETEGCRAREEAINQ